MHSNPASLNSYWRLNNYDDETVQQLKKRLKDADYPFSNGDRKPVLISKVHMVDCGAICYDRYTTAEIRQFGKDRGLPKTHTAKPARHTTVKKLVESDMSPEFHRFLDLPPEPRTRIYGHYMGDFPKEFTTPVQPPLARTCILIHDEVLPIFYGAHTHRAQFRSYPSPPRPPFDTRYHSLPPDTVYRERGRAPPSTVVCSRHRFDCVEIGAEDNLRMLLRHQQPDQHV